MSELTKKVDEKSEELMREFFTHFEECKKNGLSDRRVVFEGWIMQKMAGVHVALMRYAEGKYPIRCTPQDDLSHK